MSAELCATTPTTLPTPELKLGQISDAVAGSIDVVFSFKELMLLPYFVGSLHFETADKPVTRYFNVICSDWTETSASHSTYIASESLDQNKPRVDVKFEMKTCIFGPSGGLQAVTLDNKLCQVKPVTYTSRETSCSAAG